MIANSQRHDLTIFSLRFSGLDANAIAQRVVEGVEGDSAKLIATANVDHIARLQDDAAFRAAYDNAEIVTADGMPVFCCWQ